MLAAIDGQILFLVIAAIIGVINWISEKRKEKKQAEQPEAEPNTTADRSTRESEEERLRRFMEALGVPQGTTRPPPRPAPLQPAPPPLPRHAPGSPARMAPR